MTLPCPSVLALHGFAGTPTDMCPIMEAAAAAGLQAYAPALPGHGTSVRQLAKMRWPDWSSAGVEYLDRASAQGPVIVAGLSLGALIALYLARSRPERVLGIILMGTPLRLRFPHPALGLGAIHFVRAVDFMVPKDGPDILDSEARVTHSGYTLQPVRAAADVWHAGQLESRTLQQVRCPALIMHGAHDRVSPVRNVDRLVRGLGSQRSRVIVLPNSAHIVTRDFERNTVRAEAQDFMERCQHS